MLFEVCLNKVLGHHMLPELTSMCLGVDSLSLWNSTRGMEDIPSSVIWMIVVGNTIGHVGLKNLKLTKGPKPCQQESIK